MLQKKRPGLLSAWKAKRKSAALSGSFQGYYPFILSANKALNFSTLGRTTNWQ